MSQNEWIDVQIGDLPWSVAVQLTVVDGRTRLVGLRIEAADANDPGSAVISAEKLRSFPVRAAVRAAIEATQVDLASDWTEVDRSPGRKLPEEHYRFVATARDTALEAGRAPSGFICEMWGVSRATANAWLREARHFPSTQPDTVGQKGQKGQRGRSGRNPR